MESQAGSTIRQQTAHTDLAKIQSYAVNFVTHDPNTSAFIGR